MSFGSNVRKYRKALGMKQEELAKALGYSKSMISLVENGKKSPASSQLKKFASVLGVSMMDLLAETPREKKEGEVQTISNYLLNCDYESFTLIKNVIELNIKGETGFIKEELEKRKNSERKIFRRAFNKK